MIFNKLILSIGFITGFYLVQAQTPDEELEQYRKKYAGESAAFITHKDVVKVNFNAKSKNPITATSQSTEELILLNDNASYYADRSISSSHFSILKSFNAYSLSPGGKKYKRNSVSRVITSMSQDDMIFYDSVVEKKLFFSDIKAGCKTFIEEEFDYPEIRMMHSFFFRDFAPASSIVLELHIPSHIKIQYRILNNGDNKIQLTETQKGKENIYTFIANNTGKIKRHESAPDIRYYVPHVIFWVESYLDKGSEIPVLKTAQNMYDWKKNFLNGITDQLSDELKLTVDSLINGINDDDEKARKIFYWVQDNIKYVAFEAGLEGFIPRPAPLVCSRRYGDCKDMANIIVTMMRYANLPAYLCWIGSRSIPYKYSEFPLPNISNHMIAVYKSKNGNIFLDATGQYVKFGRPTGFIQGKEAFAAIDNSRYEIMKVPEIPYFENLNADTIVFTIENTTIKGSGTGTFTGFVKENLTHRIDGLKPADVKKFVEGFTSLGSNKYHLADYKYSQIQTRDTPLKCYYTFEVDDYVSYDKGEMYINLSLDKSYSQAFIDTAQIKDPIENDYMSQRFILTQFEIPKGYTLSYLPPETTWSDERFEFKIKYSAHGKIIRQEKSIAVKYLMLDKKYFSDINHAIQKLNAAYNEIVILKMK